MFDTESLASPSPPPPRPGALADLVATAGAIVASLEPDRYRGEQAVALVELFGELGRLAEMGMTLALGRVEETKAWSADGSRSPRAWLARHLDLGIGEAGRRFEVAAGLRRAPHLERLARSGALTAAKLDDAVRTVAVAPDCEADLAEAARTESAKAFRATCLAHRLAAEDADARHRRHRRTRQARHRIDPEGRFSFAAEGPADQGTEFLSLFRPWHDQALRALVRRGEAGEVADLGGAAAWDALLAMARAAAGATAAPPVGTAPPPPAGDPSDPAGPDPRLPDLRVPPSLRRPTGSRVKVIVRVDLGALERGSARPGEVCELAGTGPVDVGTVRRLLDDGAFLAGVTTSTDPDGTEHVHHVAHAGRHNDLSELRRRLTRAPDLSTYLHPGRSPTAEQRTAIEWRYPTCSVEGCEMPVALDIDHTDPWVDTHVTTLESLNARCRYHHRQKTAAENAARRRPGRRRDDQRPPAAASPAA